MNHSHSSHYASVQKRVMAKFIDLVIVLFLGRLPLGSAGAVLGFLYSILADSLSFNKTQGQSIGKRIMRIRVASGAGHQVRSARMKTSIVRNAPIGIVTFFLIIPIPGWILGLLIGIPLFLIELSLMIRAERRQRLGDVMAESVVLDTE
jgi:uncharacterized RDD family membrane protein YckC